MTEKTTLTERYVVAATRSIPEAQRADLAAELRASIDDQIEARVAAGEAPDAAERAVLVELGDPDRLAAGYADRPLHLIGPRHYLEWRRLLKLLLAIVLPCAAFGLALAQVLAGASFGEIVGTVVSTTIAVAVHLCFWVTLVFAIVERTGATKGGPLTRWTPDQLPEPRERSVGFGEMVASLVFLAVAAGAVVWDHFIGFVPGFPGLSFLDPGLWPWWIAALFILMALEAALNVVVYLAGRWTIGLAIANGILNLAVALPAIWLLTQDRLLNPDYFPTIIGEGGTEVGGIVAIVTGFGIAAIAIWDTVDAFLKARPARG